MAMISNSFVEEVRKQIYEEIIKTGYFKIKKENGIYTYVIDEHWPPHDERCEGTMCWCVSRWNEEHDKKWGEK